MLWCHTGPETHSARLRARGSAGGSFGCVEEERERERERVVATVRTPRVFEALVVESDRHQQVRESSVTLVSFLPLRASHTGRIQEVVTIA